MASSLSTVDWIVGGDFNMVQWEGDCGGGVGVVFSGAERKDWLRCKYTL
jgi:hypothetical protein